MGTIADTLIHYTCEHSNFEEKRDYISMSNAILSVEELISQYFSGYTADEIQLLKCYKGYQMEKDLLIRLGETYNDKVKFKIEIKAFDGLIKGHPDFSFDGFPGDCKSVLKDEWIPLPNKIPQKIYWQMQSYMLYMNQNKALLIFESRESGIIKDIWINSHSTIQNKIHEKFTIISQKIKDIAK
jgi:hypothetical protein